MNCRFLTTTATRLELSISQANLRTSDLTWETTTQTNIGLDLTVLNGRLTFNADYYYKKTKNMLMNVSLPDMLPKLIPRENSLEIPVSFQNT